MPRVNERTTSAGVVRYFVRFRLDGAQTTLTFPLADEAEQFARDCEQRGPQWAWDNYQSSEAAAAELTLDDWATRHFDALPNVGPATLAGYRRDWRRRWKPHLGAMRLSQITREDVARALKAQTGSDKTIANAWGTLSSIFKTAVIDGHLERSPTLGVRLPRRTNHEKAEHRYLTPVEIAQVVTDTPELYRPLIWMLAGTGMRWGEATALTVGDVDMVARTVSVVKAWKHDPENGWYVGPPKTRKSRRTVTLPREVVDAIAPLVTGRGRRELLFTNRDGNQIKHQTFFREHWTKACTANLADPRPRIHDLRHSHVAILIAGGVSLPVIQARLGHEKITTTIDTYGHLMPDLQVAAADAASRVFVTPAARAELQPADA